MSELATLMSDALEIMLVGMVTVFVFLALLVWLVSQMSRLAQRWHIAADGPVVSPPRARGAEASTTLPPGHIAPAKVAAISAAVHRFRQQHQVNSPQ